MKAKLLIPFLVLLIGCNTGNKPLTDAQKEAVMKDAKTAAGAFFDALAVNDTAKIMAFMDTGPEMFVVNTAGLFNFSEMRKPAEQFFAMVEKQTFETKKENYSVIGPDCFIYTWNGKNEVIMKGMPPIVYDDLVGSYTFKKRGGDWKIIHMHESEKIPEVADPVKEFSGIEDGGSTAIFNKDKNALELLLADEYKSIDSFGNITDREQDINLVMGNTFTLLATPVVSDINVRMYGTVAMVTGVITSKILVNGKDRSGSSYFIDFFVYRDGRWQCFYSQGIRKNEK